MKFTRGKTNIQGFTLTELMIVLIVLGILVSIAIPNYARSVERAKCSQAIQLLKAMRSAALSYFSDIDNQTFAGITMQDLENQVGARFFSDATENNDWIYSIAAADATSITLQATRRGGPHAAAGNTDITLTDDIINDIHEQWSDPATGYPWDNPGTW